MHIPYVKHYKVFVHIRCPTCFDELMPSSGRGRHKGNYTYLRLECHMLQVVHKNYRVSINSFPHCKRLLQENYVEYKHMQM